MPPSASFISARFASSLTEAATEAQRMRVADKSETNARHAWKHTRISGSRAEVRPPQVAGRRRRFEGKVRVVICGFIHDGLDNDQK